MKVLNELYTVRGAQITHAHTCTHCCTCPFFFLQNKNVYMFYHVKQPQDSSKRTKRKKQKFWFRFKGKDIHGTRKYL